MPNAYQLPYQEEATSQRSRRSFRKKLLPQGEIAYEGRRIRFDRDRLARMVTNFREGAVHQVPLLLANGGNAHPGEGPWNPETFRGEVTDLELGPDGLYGLIQMSDKGAELLKDNPNLGVSASVIEQPIVRADDGKTFTDVIQHVLATLNPKLTTLGAWSPTQLSTNDVAVIDLTAARFEKERDMPLSDEQVEALSKLDAATIDKLVKLTSEPTDEEKAEAEAKAKAEAEGAVHEPTEEEIAAAIEEAERAGSETAGAGLSQEAQQALDLANAAAEANRVELSGLRTELATEKWRAEAKTLVHQGVPPVDIELAAKALDPSKGTIDLSAADAVVQLQRKLDEAHSVIREQLTRLKGRVDLSGEIGTVLDGDASNVTRARELADQLKAQEKR